LALGNLIGIGIGLAQHYFKIIPLDAATYYMDAIPIHFDWRYLIGINLGTILIIGLMMLWPSHLITKISPIKALRYE
jgi:lipoprotein-releasing system permease protein